jgi:hypothetical protein
MDEDLNPKVKIKGSSPHSYNLWHLGHSTYIKQFNLGLLN